ncbi:MAG TPA: endo-1,4-beta-xylanase [Candidatus Acidoferrum sp.]|nr:endo-1,4-beta-xylanase [Candidatus Acidoferrum sp.]
MQIQHRRLPAAIGVAGVFLAATGFAQTTLKDAFKNDFLVGVAINQKQISGEDRRGDPIIKTQFNSISPENVLKWDSVHPQPDQYNFTNADKYVAFGESNHMYIVGHTLIWHSQTPRWVFRDANGKDLTREALLERMRDHIHAVVGRYQGRIQCWDVVNEALAEDGTLRKSAWLRIIGEDYIAKAFQYAHEADPNAVLRYNDYSLEDEPKRKGAIALIKKLKAEGVPVTAIGLQDHAKLDWPTAEQEDATITDLAGLGLKVMITELDVDTARATQQNRSADINLNGQGGSNSPAAAPSAGMNQNTNRSSDSVEQLLAKRYVDLFGVFVKHRDVVSLVTFWGVTDGDSWLNWGRVNHPLLFDRDGRPKPAFDAVIQTAKSP